MHSRVGVQCTSESSPRNNFPLHDGQGLLGGFGGIVNERVGVFARAQGAVGFVAAVGEGLAAMGNPASRKRRASANPRGQPVTTSCDQRATPEAIARCELGVADGLL